jgi:RNase P subunit RPR2
MAATRDRYSISYTCKKCGAKGFVQYSEKEEDDGDGNLDLKIENVEGDVDAKYAGENNVEVKCKKCGSFIPH